MLNRLFTRQKGRAGKWPGKPAFQLSLFAWIKPGSAAGDVPPERLEAVWERLRAGYFPERHDLSNYRLRWSSRAQKRCLASCNVYARTVNVAEALRDPGAAEILEPLLYHEMCHAVLGPPRRNGRRRVYHGPEFRELERRHPAIALLDRWIASGGWARLSRRSRMKKRRATASGEVRRPSRRQRKC
jgi:hypothetical protein